MFFISVKRLINKPIQEVFDAISDHESYGQFKAIDNAKLLKEGEQDKNGVGALREICASGAVLHEAITAYESPVLMKYKIVYSKPLPYDHQLGEIRLSEEGNKTRVIWRSQGHITIPLLGNWYFDKQIQKHGSRAFGSILKAIDES